LGLAPVPADEIMANAGTGMLVDVQRAPVIGCAIEPGMHHDRQQRRTEQASWNQESYDSHGFSSKFHST
jgi:hypothetical protein